MGTWGAGPFENDNAREYLDSVLEKFFTEIQEEFEEVKSIDPIVFLYHGDHKFIPALDIYTTLLIEYDGYPELELDTFKQWKTVYFDIFDRDDAVNPPKFKEERRTAVMEVFNRLESYLLDWYNDPRLT